MSLSAITAGCTEQEDAPVSFTHVKLCQMSHWFWEFWSLFSTCISSPTHSPPSPTKTNTAGKMRGQALKMLTTGKKERAVQQRIRAKAGSRAAFLTELAALCCFTANTGSEPKERLTSYRERKATMNGLDYIRMKPFDRSRLGEARLPVSVCVCV